MNEKERTAAYQSSTLGQRAFGFVLFNLALQLFIVGFTLYLMSLTGFFNQQFHAYLTLAVSVVSTAFVAAGLALIQAGRVRKGLFFAYYANFGTATVLTLLYASRTISAGITLALISLVFIFWLFPRQERRGPAIALGVFGLWLVIIQLLDPVFRQVDLPNADLRPGPGMAIAFVAFVAIFLMLQARRGNIRFKLIALLSSLALVSVFIVSSVVYLSYQQQIRADIRQRLLNMVSLAALQQNGDLHVTLQPGDQDTAAYLEIQRANRKILATDPDLVFVYTMRMNQAGQIYFVVDATDPADEDFSALGDIYESPGPLLAEGLSALREPVVEEDFYTDEYGTFLSAYAPFYTSDGLQAGVIGMDILADTVLAQENEIFTLIAGTTVGALLFVILVGALFGNVFARPIRSLADTARQVAAGDLSAQAEVLTEDEVGTLATVFNTMTAQLSQTLAGLETRVAARTRDLQLAAQIGQRLSRL
ncbi:MAG: HAMP domain-containing protein, partial [Anaerolineales bacterium]|nr:HAMP domain-containing protein [Anaerolineales bacterium]